MTVRAWTIGGAAGGAALGGLGAAAMHRSGAEVALTATVGAGVGAAELGTAALLGSHGHNPYLVGAGEAAAMAVLTYAAYAAGGERYSWTEAILSYLVTAGITTLAAWTSRPASAPPLYKPPTAAVAASRPRPRVAAIIGGPGGYTQKPGSLA